MIQNDTAKYTRIDSGYLGQRIDGEGFLITAYQTDAIKEGEKVWPK